VYDRNIFEFCLGVFSNLSLSLKIFRKMFRNICLTFGRIWRIFRKSPETLNIMYWENIFQYLKRNFISQHGHVISSILCHFSSTINNAFFSFQIRWKPLKECCLSRYSVCLIKWWQCTRMQNSMLKGEKILLKWRYFLISKLHAHA